MTFEHDDCGCPGGDDRHEDDPDQDGDMWWSEWEREDARAHRRSLAAVELEELQRDARLEAVTREADGRPGQGPWKIYCTTAAIATTTGDTQAVDLGAFVKWEDALTALVLWSEDRKQRSGTEVEIEVSQSKLYRTIDDWLDEQGAQI